MELEIAYFLRAYPTVYCAACNQHCHTTYCSLSASCCFVSSVAQEGQAMTEKEREILYKLLIDLFVEKPAQKRLSQKEQEHESVTSSTGTKRARNRAASQN